MIVASQSLSRTCVRKTQEKITLNDLRIYFSFYLFYCLLFFISFSSLFLLFFPFDLRRPLKR